VMSLEVDLGCEGNVFAEIEEHAYRVSLTSPVLSQGKFNTLLNIEDEKLKIADIDATYDPENGDLRSAVEGLCLTAETAVRGGATLLILSDRKIGESRLPIHSLLATGAVHHHLIRSGLRFPSLRLPAGIRCHRGVPLFGLQYSRRTAAFGRTVR
jgi:glutamate synthase (NADPH/NADH) large chain